MSKTCNYAVVHWFNYRKNLKSGFLKGFNDLEEAKTYAYKRARKDCPYWNSSVITEDEITDNNGPGKSGSPYDSIVGYGGEDETGYCTKFYCVVEWFPGVTNKWHDLKEDSRWKKLYGDEWYPKYSYRVILSESTILAMSKVWKSMLQDK